MSNVCAGRARVQVELSSHFRHDEDHHFSGQAIHCLTAWRRTSCEDDVGPGLTAGCATWIRSAQHETLGSRTAPVGQ